MDRIQTLLKMLEAKGEDPFLQHALALEYVKLGAEAKARAYFENILQQHPGYIGSYYHLAKLLERCGETAAAEEWYRKGIAAARTAGDHHARNELQAALDDLLDL